jgi:nicotinamide mononucleotide adenylyltransferase
MKEFPWHVAMNHWGIPDILQEVEEGVKWDLTVNGVPHRYICKQVDNEQAHQIVNAHNASLFNKPKHVFTKDELRRNLNHIHGLTKEQIETILKDYYD